MQLQTLLEYIASTQLPVSQRSLCIALTKVLSTLSSTSAKIDVHALADLVMCLLAAALADLAR